MDPLKLSKIKTQVQDQSWDKLKSDTHAAMAPKGSFAQRVVNLFSSASTIEARNNRITADLMSSLSQQVGQQIAGDAVSTLLESRTGRVINQAQVRDVIAQASLAYASAVEAFSDSALTRDYFPGGSQCAKPISEAAQATYVSTLINHCLAQSFEMGLSPREMVKLLADPQAGHPEHRSALQKMASDVLPHIANHALKMSSTQFQRTQVDMSYREICQACLKGLPWYGLPEEEGAKLFRKRGKEPIPEFRFGSLVLERFEDPVFVGIRNVGFDAAMAAEGLDVRCDESLSNNKLHISIHPDDMDKAFQVMLPLLLSKDLPYDALKFTNFENNRPGLQAHLAQQKTLAETGATPEIRKHAADAPRRANRVHVGNQVTLYCPTFADEKTRAITKERSKAFLQTLEQELRAAGVRPGDKSEGHALPGMDYTTFRWESNPRVPTSELSPEQMQWVQGSDIYQSFH